MILRAASCAALLLLSGCATFMKTNEQKTAQANWDSHRSTVQRIDHFVLHARVSSGGMFGLRGDLLWTQKSDGNFEARITGPFGIGALTISGKDKDIEVRTKKGTYRTADPEKWIKDKMGWSFPIMGLRHWVLGVPSPHSKADLELSLEGQAVVMTQDGWTLSFNEYQDLGGLKLPRKFEIANPEIKIKVVADRWEELPVQVAKK